jgi:hypothetical protein
MNSAIISSASSLRTLSQSVAQAAQSLGFSNPGDGGNASYWLNTNDTTTPDNGMTIFVNPTDDGRWYLSNSSSVSAKQIGALGNGSSDDSTVFGTSLVPSIFVAQSGAPYRISSNTTVSADLIFYGGQITVDAGVTLTINGSILAGSEVLFKGDGTVVINRGEIDVAWFDGADAAAKTAFCLRGLSNTNGTGKSVVYKTPQPNDAWAATSLNSQWGYGWNVTAPVDWEQAQAYTNVFTHSSFVVTKAVNQAFLFGSGTYKCDGLHFPVRLKIDGGNGLAPWALQSCGSSHLTIDYLEAYYCGGVALTPNGNKQCSDINIGVIDTGELYNPAVLMDGSAGPNCSITDVKIGFVSSTGFVSGHAADAVVKIASNCNAITIGPVEHRAVNAGFVDATEAVVLITNGGSYGSTYASCRYGINIGPVTNGSTTQTAECIVVADATSGAAAKMTGITIDAGSQNDTGSPPGNASISLSYTVGAVVKGLPAASGTNVAQRLTINPSCTGTLIYGMTPNQVTDNGVATLINGHNYGPIQAVTVSASPMTWVNNTDYDADFQLQGGSVTAVNLTRGQTALSLYNGAALGSGCFSTSPGDTIKLYYASGSPPVANIIPR